MRLIDADTLKYRRKDYGGYDDVSDEERKEGILFLLKEDIDNAPTIDPVKHGKWIERKKCRTTKDGAFHTYRFKVCSECGRASGRRMNRPTHYCPNCGAQME